MLTPREEEIAALVAQGMTNREIAKMLGGISSRTVSSHIAHILDKLRLQNRVQIAVHWIERDVAA